MKLSKRWLHPTAVVCLLLSGVAGLVYQVAWARYLALLLGHTSYAVVAVLVAFMGGLALGNAWFGRFADRVARPLALYAWLEIGIAAYAGVFPTYFELCRGAYVALAQGGTPGSPWLLLLKFLFSAAAILIPTTLMGGTLPVMTRLVTRSLGELRARVAGLYFINSAGAVAGVLIADFWWIPAMGLDATVFGGATLNALVGALALIVNAGLEESADRPETAPGPAGVLPGTRPVTDGAAGSDGGLGEERYTVGEWRLAVGAAGVSGFVAMLYEVVWTRVLALALGSSTHAFSIMLVTFIAGITAGAWVVGRWRARRGTFDAFGWAELALALTLLVSMGFYDLLPYAFARLGSTVVRAPEHHALYQGLQFLVCFVVMFAPALCLGMTLPLASRVATSELSRTGRSVGLVFSVNTLGTVLGAALTGMVFLPYFGLARTFALGVGLNLALALVVLGRRREGLSRAAMVGAPIVVVGLMALAQAGLSDSWNRAFSLGLWRVRNLPGTVAEYRASLGQVDLTYHRDGAGSTVSVNSWTNPATGKAEITLRVNGKADATSRGDLSTQLLLAHLPLMLRPEARDVMIVGVGSGITCAAALTHASVRHVDAVEISPEVVEAARTQFAPHNRGALEEERVSVVIDDAKSFLLTSGRKYDVIISEPSNPWMAGVAGVFSGEFYETCAASLADSGVMVQWVHVYETSDDALRTVLATFTSVFPFLSVWQTLPGDLVLVGTTKPMKYDLAAMERTFREPSVTEDLRRADLFSLPVLLALQVVSDYNAPFLFPPGTPRHGDFHPVLEYQAERGFFARGDATLHEVFNETQLRRPSTLLGEHLRRHPLTVTDAQSLALAYTAFRLPSSRYMRAIVERWRELDPHSLLAAEYASKLEYPLPVAQLEADRMAPVRDAMMAEAATNPEPLRMYSRHLMHAYRALRCAFYQPPTNELAAVLARLAETDTVNRQSHLLRQAEIAWDTGEDDRFMALATEAFVRQRGAPAVGKFDLDFGAPGYVLFLLVETLWRGGRYADARLWCDAVREGGYLRPDNRFYSPLLDMVVRKVEAAVPSGPANGAEPPAIR